MQCYLSYASGDMSGFMTPVAEQAQISPFSGLGRAKFVWAWYSMGLV